MSPTTADTTNMSWSACRRRREPIVARLCASEGFTLLEVIFVAGVIMVLSGIAVPSLLRGRAAANETATIGTMRVIHTGELTYTLTCGAGLYAASLPALAPGQFLPPDLTANLTPMKSGYTYTLAEGPSGLTGLVDCNGAPLATDYYVTATPLTLGTTGNRAFASNQAHVIWQNTAGTPPIEPFANAGTVSNVQ